MNTIRHPGENFVNLAASPLSYCCRTALRSVKGIIKQHSQYSTVGLIWTKQLTFKKFPQYSLS